MNVMWYVGKFDEATWQLFATFGLTPSFLQAQGRGMAAVQQNIAYKKELHAGNVVSVRPEEVEPVSGRDIQARSRADCP